MSNLARGDVTVRSCLAFLLVVALGTGCRDASEPSASASTTEVELNGVITQVFPVDPGLEPTRFVLRTSSGPVNVRLRAGHPYGFDLQHLREHARTQDPVAIVAERNSGTLYALSISDT